MDIITSWHGRLLSDLHFPHATPEYLPEVTLEDLPKMLQAALVSNSKMRRRGLENLLIIALSILRRQGLERSLSYHGCANGFWQLVGGSPVEIPVVAVGETA
jgi:hypothetical protein